MAWSKFIDLGYSDDEMDARYGGMADELRGKQSRCPGGLCIRLTTRELKIARLPVPDEGDMIDMRVFGTVRDNKDGILIELDKIALENEADEIGEVEDEDE